MHGWSSVLLCVHQKPVGASDQHGPTLTGQTAQLWTPLLQKTATTKTELKNQPTKGRNNETAFIQYDFTATVWLIFGD